MSGLELGLGLGAKSSVYGLPWFVVLGLGTVLVLVVVTVVVLVLVLG